MTHGQKLRAPVQREVTTLPFSSVFFPLLLLCFPFFLVPLCLFFTSRSSACFGLVPLTVPLPVSVSSLSQYLSPVSNFPVFFPSSLCFVSFLFFSLRSLLPLVLALRVVFLGKRGAGASLSPSYRCAWGAGPSCPATVPDEVANGFGLQGTASLVSHHEGAWGFGFWRTRQGERDAGRSKEEKTKSISSPAARPGEEEGEQCRSKRYYFVPSFFKKNLPGISLIDEDSATSVYIKCQ